MLGAVSTETAERQGVSGPWLAVLLITHLYQQQNPKLAILLILALGKQRQVEL